MRGARRGGGAQVVVEGRMPTMPPAALQEGPGCLLARGLLGGLAVLSDTAALAAGNPVGVTAQGAAAARRPTAPPPQLLAEGEGAADRATRTGIAVRSADQTGLHFGAFQVASDRPLPVASVDAGACCARVPQCMTIGAASDNMIPGLFQDRACVRSAALISTSYRGRNAYAGAAQRAGVGRNSPQRPCLAAEERRGGGCRRAGVHLKALP